MKIASTVKKPIVSVSAYIDAKATHIESLKLNAVDRLEKARNSADGAMDVILDGQRHSRAKDVALFAGLGLAPAALASWAGWGLHGATGALVGGALGLATFTAPAGYFLGRSLKAPQWKAETRRHLGKSTEPSPGKAGPQRLSSLVDQARESNPRARQILFLSGHGDRTTLASMKLDEMANAMENSSVDITILDACLQGQLEVLTRLAPWAGLVLASPHKIKARGLELEEILRPHNLTHDSSLEAACQMAREAKSTTPSFAVVDTVQFREQLLPALDSLGRKLADSWSDDSLSEGVKSALSDTVATDGFFSRRVDLGSFLEELHKRQILPQQTSLALESFQNTVPFRKNEHSLSFHLKAGREDPSLPPGWRDLLKKMDLSFKPLL
jgi:hypothetical protein